MDEATNTGWIIVYWFSWEPVTLVLGRLGFIGKCLSIEYDAIL